MAAKTTANNDTIRCAILTAEMRNQRGHFIQDAVDVLIIKIDGRTLEATRVQKGWFLAISDDGKIISRVAARHGSKHDRPQPTSYFARLLAGRERFSWQEAEEVMKQFLSSTTYPASVSWVGKDKTSI